LKGAQLKNTKVFALKGGWREWDRAQYLVEDK
jgi:hypothetical protein